MARNDASPTALSTLLALALIPAFWPSGAMAQEACTDQSTDLIADETMVVGDINVCDDATTLTVTYETTYPWCLLETRLHVATSEEGIPRTRSAFRCRFSSTTATTTTATVWPPSRSAWLTSEPAF